MKLRTVCQLLEAEVVAGQAILDDEIVSACGSDLLSDVMAFAKDSSILLSGLATLQTVRTANLMDIRAVILVRGKLPTRDMVDEAEKNGMLLAVSKYSMFLSCGKLYEGGLRQGSMYGEIES